MSGVAVKRIWNMEEKEKRKSDEREMRADKAGVLREKSAERKESMKAVEPRRCFGESTSKKLEKRKDEVI